jgi:hypothetical protein
MRVADLISQGRATMREKPGSRKKVRTRHLPGETDVEIVMYDVNLVSETPPKRIAVVRLFERQNRSRAASGQPSPKWLRPNGEQWRPSHTYDEPHRLDCPPEADP